MDGHRGDLGTRQSWGDPASTGGPVFPDVHPMTVKRTLLSLGQSSHVALLAHYHIQL
jgi:hypothetical protein